MYVILLESLPLHDPNDKYSRYLKFNVQTYYVILNHHEKCVLFSEKNKIAIIKMNIFKDDSEQAICSQCTLLK